MSELLGGKYEVLELAGEGGMAEVYRGQTHGAGGFTRPVAIKRLMAPLSHNPEFLKMFVEEARVVSELDHPNIAQIHDFDRDRNGEYYLVLEWVDGLTLWQWRQAHREHGHHVPWNLTAAIGIEVLDALHAAHERRDQDGKPAPVFHRDVTPQNVMLSSCGVAKLTDFGLARAMDRAAITKPGFVKGKPSYLAPDLPEELRRIVTRALRRNPIERYASSREMGRELASLLRSRDAPTDAYVVAESVRWAREQLASSEGPGKASDSLAVGRAFSHGGAADQTVPDPSIPLIRRK